MNAFRQRKPIQVSEEEIFIEKSAFGKVSRGLVIEEARVEKKVKSGRMDFVE